MAASDVKRLLAERVRDARRAAGLTQAQLAEASGVTDETISRLERGAYEASVSTVVALADALGVSLDSMIGRSGARNVRPAVAPLVQRLADRAEQLDVGAQRVLLDLARLLPRSGAARRVPRRR